MGIQQTIFMKKYAQSEKGKIARRRYNKSLKGKKNKFKKELKRRERYKKVIHKFTFEEWNRKKRDSFGVCKLCNKFVGIDKLELDHIIPLCKSREGQVYTIDDIQPLCSYCNKVKD